jgi:hypothetical protein
MSAGVGPLDAGSPEQQAAQEDSEWRRWEESEKWHWQPARRAAWAEALWRRQHLRRRQRLRFIREVGAHRRASRTQLVLFGVHNRMHGPRFLGLRPTRGPQP